MPLYSLILALTALAARVRRALRRSRPRPRCYLDVCKGVLEPIGPLRPAGSRGVLCEHACSACGARVTLMQRYGDDR
jgi:hypothetical protein